MENKIRPKGKVDIVATFGDRLRSLRKEKGLTQKEIGALLGVSADSIGKYESGDRTPEPNDIIILAKFFGVSADYLLGISDIRQPPTINDEDLPPDWLNEVEFIRRAGTKLSPEERKAIIELAKLFVKRVEAERRQGEKKNGDANYPQ